MRDFRGGLRLGWRLVLAGLALVAVVSVISGCGGGNVRSSTRSRTTSGAPLNFGQFAGYLQVGPIVSGVSATLTVPEIAPSLRPAAAGTWVGAEDLGPNDLREPFIQVGINEVAPGSSRPGVYYAFWTDTAHGYRALELFPVHAGDRVSASLVLVNHRWVVTIADGRVQRRVVTPQEAQATLQAALWFQEDVTTSMRTGQLAQYPHLAAVRISNLSVNGKAPRTSGLGRAWMSVGGTVFQPTVVRRDAFTVTVGEATVPLRLRTLLRTLGVEDAALVKPQLELDQATDSTPRSQEIRWASQLSKALDRIVGTLRGRTWPAHARTSVEALVQAVHDLVEQTRLVGHFPVASYNAWRTIWSEDVAATIVARARLIRALRLPYIPVTASRS